MRIGEVARQAGTTPKTIRYYEEIGLMPEAVRAPNGYRDYGEDAVYRLAFIRDAQASGLSLSEIHSILDLRSRGQSTCEHVAGLLERHLSILDAHIESMQVTRSKLFELTERARRLDPEDCKDPIRCQTINVAAGESPLSVDLHPALAEHHH